jgi:O-antigen/teichoic acid export membrane protein
MGVVRKQSIISSLFTYIGFAIGAINILFLFPKFFTPQEIGLTRILIDVSLLLSTLCTLGSIPMILKFFPFYQKYLPASKNDLPFLSLILAFLGMLIIGLCLPELKPWIIKKFGSKSPLFVDYFDLLYPLTFSVTLFSIFEAYSWSLKKTILSNTLKEFSIRILTTILICLFIVGLLNYNNFIIGFSLIYFIPALILYLSLSKEKALPLNISFSSLTKRIGSKMFTLAGFLFSASILNIIARTNDTIILASQSSGGLSDAAVFTIATYLITVMEVPQRSLISIATPFISEAMQKRDIEKINRLYKKTSLNLMIAGLCIFGVILLNLNNINNILGPSYQALSGIVIITGIAKIIDLATGMNTQILLLSKYWRLDFFTNILLVSLSIPLNYFLTKEYNSMGPAYGNLIAIIIFNSVRFLYIWKIFKIQPFTYSNIKTLLVFILSVIICFGVPNQNNTYLDIFVKTSVFLSIYLMLTIKWNISPDLNEVIITIKNKLKLKN